MNEEVMRVLKMVEEGKISSEEAKEIIDSLGDSKKISISIKDYNEKMLKVKITSADGDDVNVKLPIKVIKEIIKATGKIPMVQANMNGVNMDDFIETIVASLDSSVVGEIVNITSGDGDEIKVFVE